MEQLCFLGRRSIWISASAKSPAISLCCVEVALWLSVLIHFLVDLHSLTLLPSSFPILTKAHHNFWQLPGRQFKPDGFTCRWDHCRWSRCRTRFAQFLCRQRIKQLAEIPGWMRKDRKQQKINPRLDFLLLRWWMLHLKMLWAGYGHITFAYKSGICLFPNLDSSKRLQGEQCLMRWNEVDPTLQSEVSFPVFLIKCVS